LKVMALLLATYAVCYATLSTLGRYQEIEDQYGRKWAVWCPSGCYLASQWRGLPDIKLTDLGFVFLPLIIADHKIVHQRVLTFSVQGDGYQVARITADGKRIQPAHLPYSGDGAAPLRLRDDD